MAHSILILSDLHMGFRGRSIPTASSIRPLWQGFDHLILNGDTAELHERGCVDAAERQSRELVSACREDGTGLSIIAGNHDPFISDLTQLSLRQKQVLVTHGHTIHRDTPRPLVPGQVFESGDESTMLQQHAMHTEKLEAALKRSRTFTPPEEELETPRTFSGSIGYAVSRPMILMKIIGYWKKFPNWGNQFAERVQPETSVIVLGHSHRQGIWTFGNRMIVNTGSYSWPGRPWAVKIKGNQLSVHRIRKDGSSLNCDAHAIESVNLAHTS